MEYSIEQIELTREKLAMSRITKLIVESNSKPLTKKDTMAGTQETIEGHAFEQINQAHKDAYKARLIARLTSNIQHPNEIADLPEFKKTHDGDEAVIIPVTKPYSPTPSPYKPSISLALARKIEPSPLAVHGIFKTISTNSLPTTPTSNLENNTNFIVK